MDLRSILPKSFAVLEALENSSSVVGPDWDAIDNAVRKALIAAVGRRSGVILRRQGEPMSAAAVAAQKWRDANPHKRAAHDAVKHAGLKSLPCEGCGSSETEAHHDDYGRPLEVRWLCKSCHTRLHKAA